MNKCDLLKRAAKSYGIEPQLECLATETESCMKAVQADAADVMATQPDDLYVGYRYIIVIGLAKFHIFFPPNIVTAVTVSAIGMFCVLLEIYTPLQIFV
jgi:hypothetical protein